ncbi:hypothetical protein HPP92_014439, partial [Vanilla planifolia]
MLQLSVNVSQPSCSTCLLINILPLEDGRKPYGPTDVGRRLKLGISHRGTTRSPELYVKNVPLQGKGLMRQEKDEPVFVWRLKYEGKLMAKEEKWIRKRAC